MKMLKILNYFLLAAASVCVLSFAASADTLHLKSGETLHGHYSGGTDDSIRFVVDGETRVFRLDEVTALNFSTDDQDAQPISMPPAPVPPQSSQPNAAPSDDAQNAAPAPPVPPPSAAPPQSDERVTLPTDSPVTVRMVDSVDSRYDQPGKRFHATLDQDLQQNGILVAPKGTDVYGRLTYASQAGHIQGRAELRLELTTIMINGQARAMSTGEYHLAGKSRGKQSAERIGGAAIGGAIIGGILGGGQGAAAGAALGAGAGTTVPARNGR